MTFHFTVDVTSVVAGVLGLVAGMVGTFWVNVLLERRRSNASTRRLHCVLLSEILTHQASLARTLDFTLPAWLCRGHKRNWRSKDFQNEYLSTGYFDTFLDKLVDSRLLIPVALYYDAAKHFNRRGSDLIKSTEAASGISQPTASLC